MRLAKTLTTIMLTAGSLSLAGCGDTTTTPPPSAAYQDSQTSLQEIFPKGAVITWNPNICEADLLIQRGQVVVPAECGIVQRWYDLSPQAKVVFCENLFERDRYSLSRADAVARDFLHQRYGVYSWRDCQRRILAIHGYRNYRYR